MAKDKNHIHQCGILGGGQLAQMLAQSAITLGFEPIVYTDDSSAPASRCAKKTIVGQIDNTKKLSEFVNGVEVVAFENEFIDCEKLRLLDQDCQNKLFPSIDSIEVFQNKLSQKRLMEKLEIPTSEFQEYLQSDHSNLNDWLEQVLSSYGGDAVLKWARFGYDGKGVYFANTRNRNSAELIQFVNEAIEKKIPIYAERKVNFRRELAMVAVRSIHGEFVSYPLVISEQKNGICRKIIGPATALGCSLELEQRASDYLRKLAEQSKLVGTFAMEFFETNDGDLLANEIAPRVHNSGHYTIDACKTSQFANHWLAITSAKLGIVSSKPGFAMLNVLGPDQIYLSDSEVNRTDIASMLENLPGQAGSIVLHWYYKKEIKPNRKIGHFNGWVKSPKDIQTIIKIMEDCEQAWIRKLRSL